MSSAIGRLVPRSAFFYRLCRVYVDWFRGDNNVDMTSNGELVLMRRMLPTARVIFDVGANVGDWAAIAMSINPRAALHCFEPSPDTFRVLEARGVRGNVVLNNFAFGAMSGQATLFGFSRASPMNSLYARAGLEHVGISGPDSTSIVSVKTVDDYCAEQCIERVDFVKVDVEGHELAVIQGMRSMLKRGAIGAIQFEYGGTYIDSRILLRDVWETIRAANEHYSFYKLHHDGPQHVARYTQALENFQFQNWVAILA